MSVSKENTYTTHRCTRLQIFQNGFRMNRVKKLYLLGSKTTIYRKYTIENLFGIKILISYRKENVSVHSAILFFNILE